VASRNLIGVAATPPLRGGPPETGLSAEDACRSAVGGSAWFCFIDCDFAIKFVAESETSGGATL